MTVGGKKASAMLPKERPDLFAVGDRQLKLVQLFARGKLKRALGVCGRQFG